MPIYLLGSRTSSVQIPNQTLSIAIAGSVEHAALHVDGGAGQNVVRINAHLALIPAIGSELSVIVKPIGVQNFSHDTIVYLSISPDSPAEIDPVQLSFDPVNVSGCGAMELATLSPRGAHIEVSARAVADAPLGRLASMARTAARRVGGSGKRPRGGSLSIGVDTSASMSGAFADGSVSAAIELLVGVADVTGIRNIAATLVGARGVPVDAPAADLAQAVTRHPVRWSAGARWSVLPQVGRTVLVTDFVSDAVPQNRSTLCISGDTRLGGPTPLLAPPPAGVGAEDNLTANPALIDNLAAALLPILS